MSDTNSDRLRAAATGTESSQTRAMSIFSYLDNPKVQAGLTAVAPKYLKPERIMRLYVSVVHRTPDLMKCDAKSVLGAFMTTTALGLEPNTVQQLAFLIPYKRWAKRGGKFVEVYDCQFQIGARGFVTLYYRVPTVLQVAADAIHENDHWKHMEGSNSFLEFSKALSGRGQLTGSFSHVKLRDGGESACVLELDDIHRIRESSETWRALTRRVDEAKDEQDRQKAERKLADTPWEKWIDEMAKKSAVKRHAKLLPIAASDSDDGRRLDSASEIDGRGDTRKLDLRSMTDPDVVRSVINDGFDPPDPVYEDEEEDVSGEAYGGTGRAAAADQLEAKAADGAARKAEAETKVTEKKAEAVDDWQPTPEQRRKILEMEKAEAEAARVVETQAPAPAPAAPAPAVSVAVRRRSTNLPPME